MSDESIKGRQDALRKAMDYLSRRDHSKFELMKKLTRCEFEVDDIIYALDYLEEGGWLLSPQAMAEKVADQLHRKKKSHFYIQGYLRQKKLPSVNRDSALEREKARKLIESRFSHLSNPSTGDKKQMSQYLQNRGYDRETIAKVIHEASGDSKSI